MTTGKQLVRFLAAGGAAITADFGVYYLLRNVLPVAGAKGISFVCGGVAAYLLNTYWVFEQRRASSAGAVKFAVASTLLLGVNVLTNSGVLKVWPTAVAEALVLATLVTGALSFVCFKWWVFRAQGT